MYRLVAGMVPECRLALIMSLTNITSDDIRKGLKYYLVNGYNNDTLKMIFGKTLDDIYKALTRLNEISEKIEKYKEINIEHQKAPQETIRIEGVEILFQLVRVDNDKVEQAAIERVVTGSSFRALGKKHNVQEKSIRRACERYNTVESVVSEIAKGDSIHWCEVT